MKVELINWTEETGGRIIKIDCKINQKFKSFYVLDTEIKKAFFELFNSEWQDQKSQMNKDQKVLFIKHFFTI